MIVKRTEWPDIRAKLEKLFFESFGRPIQPDYLDWRYFNNEKNQLLFSLEISDNNAVASYSAFPVDLISDGKVFQTAMSMTTMTHPTWRGKGLFQNLAKELYAKGNDFQIGAVWGFPNDNSHITFISKLGWNDIYEIPTMALELNNVNVEKYSLDPTIKTDNLFSFIYPGSQNDNLIRIHKTKSYLAWRYAKNPINNYENYVIEKNGEVSSYVITKRYGNDIDIVDIQTDNAYESNMLLMHIIKNSLNNDVHNLYCWAPSHHFVHGVLERLGFKNSAPVTYFGGLELIQSKTPSGWLNYNNWYIQMGDSDVY